MKTLTRLHWSLIVVVLSFALLALAKQVTGIGVIFMFAVTLVFYVVTEISGMNARVKHMAHISALTSLSEYIKINGVKTPHQFCVTVWCNHQRELHNNNKPMVEFMPEYLGITIKESETLLVVDDYSALNLVKLYLSYKVREL